MGRYLPEKKFERSMQHNYLILKETESDVNMQYMKKMITENKIPGLLPVSIRYIDGQEAYYYEIHSKQSIDRIFERKNISNAEQMRMIKSYLSLQKQLEEYLLAGESLLLDPSFIYMNTADGSLSFVYFPEYVQDSRMAFQGFMEWILNKIDHTDEQAVMFAYQLYKYTREDNYMLDEIQKMVDKQTLDTPNIESVETKETEEIRAEVEFEKDEQRNLPDFKQEDMQMNMLSATAEERVYETQNHTDKAKGRHRILSLICMGFAMTSFVIFMLMKTTKFIPLPQSFEMIVFAFFMMFAVSGILFRRLIKKQEEREIDMEEIETQQFEKMQENFHKEEIYDTKQEDILTKREENMQYFPPSAGETTVLGSMSQSHQNILIRKDGNHREQYEMTQFPYLIGRMQSYVDLLLEDSSISKMHARIEMQEGKVYIQDMNSTNGTYKNGTALAPNELAELLPGDEIMLGRVIFAYQ